MSAFARASIAPDEDRAVATQYPDGGVAFSNVVFEDSLLGLGASHTIFGDDYIRTDPGVTSSETVVEATSLIPVSENSGFQPDIQYLLDPHFSGRDAVVPGLRGVVSF
jgi:carbohydrate-selective porin OprB